MRKLRALVDVDGVIADFCTPAFAAANQLLGTDHKVEDLDVLDIATFMKFDRDEEKAFYQEVNKPGFHNGIHPYPGAVVAMKQLRKIADVLIVTAPMFGPAWCWDRWEWLGQHFGIRKKDVVFTHQKQCIRGDFLVDDKPANVEKWVDENPLGIGFIWHQHYTNPVDDVAHSRIRRTRGWDDLFALVKELLVY